MAKQVRLTPAPPTFRVNKPKVTPEGNCIQCGSKCVIKIGLEHHCNQCGHQWGKAEVMVSPSRADLANGWKQPNVKKIADGLRRFRTLGHR